MDLILRGVALQKHIDRKEEAVEIINIGIGAAFVCYLIAFLNLLDAIRERDKIFTWILIFIFAPVTIPTCVIWRLATMP